MPIISYQNLTSTDRALEYSTCENHLEVTAPCVHDLWSALVIRVGEIITFDSAEANASVIEARLQALGFTPL